MNLSVRMSVILLDQREPRLRQVEHEKKLNNLAARSGQYVTNKNDNLNACAMLIRVSIVRWKILACLKYLCNVIQVYQVTYELSHLCIFLPVS